MRDLYHNILDQKCRLEQQILKNAILLIHNQHDLFAYNLVKELDYMAIMSGEVAHIIIMCFNQCHASNEKLLPQVTRYLCKTNMCTYLPKVI